MSLWMGERLQNRGEAQSQTSAAVHLQPLSISVLLCLFMSSLAFSSPSLAFPFLFHSASPIAFQISRVSFLCSRSVFLIFPDFSSLTRGLLPLKECLAQAKVILWLFCERVYFMPLHNIKSTLYQLQSQELNLCLHFDLIIPRISVSKSL